MTPDASSTASTTTPTTPVAPPADTAFTAGPVEVLEDQECWELLEATRFGRLVLTVVDTTDVWPVDFAVAGRSLVIRTAEGTKLLEAVIARRGVLEADRRDEESGCAWSVVVKGDVDVIGDDAGHAAAEALQIPTWVGGWRHRYLRLSAREVSGRRFVRRSATPEDEG